MKRIIALALVLCMSLSLVVSVSAAPGSFSSKLNLVRLIRTMFGKNAAEEVIGDNGDDIFDLYIDNVSINEYDIVYPEGAELPVYYTAVAFADYLADRGITVDVKSDAEAETKYEILIGDTNREISVDDTVVLGDNEYVICKTDSKVVMLGESFMIAGGVSAFVNEFMIPADGELDVNITTLSENADVKTYTWQTPDSVIYMIGDGMGMKHIQAAKDLREELPVFYAENFPYFTRVKTFSYSVHPLGTADSTDSAASATALSTGYKTINYFVGVDPDEQPLLNIRELAHSKGAKTAVLTTDHITGATPAGFLCHHNSRNDGGILQDQIDALTISGEVDYCVGTSDSDNLTDKAREALSLISKDGDPYFIMIEEAYIDKTSHAQNMDEMPDKVIRFNDCITYCAVFSVIRGDTMVLVTADHETGGVSQSVEGWYFPYSFHTNTSVPLYCIGYEGLADLVSKKSIDNTDIPKFIAKVLYGVEDFGDQDFVS